MQAGSRRDCDSGLIRRLADGPLDVIGDVHGEIEALDALLHALGYDADARHPDGRTLVFVGDLCDRGPDSVAVIGSVQRWIAAGRAQCVLGNHELNLLRRDEKDGNGWFFSGRPHLDDGKRRAGTDLRPRTADADAVLLRRPLAAA